MDPLYITIDEQNKQLEILDFFRQIKKYTLEGDYIASQPCCTSSEFEKLGNNYLFHSFTAQNSKKLFYGTKHKIKETKKYPAIIMEFKVRNIKREESLEDTVQTALTQIKEKCYDAELYDRGLKKEEIHHYGFAFEGKKVLIG